MRAHARRALLDRLFERAAGALVDILLGEVRAWRRRPRGSPRRACPCRSGSGRAGRTCRDGYASRRSPAPRAGRRAAFPARLSADRRLDRRDPALADTDIGRALRAAGDARFAQDQIEIHDALRFSVSSMILSTNRCPLRDRALRRQIFPWLRDRPLPAPDRPQVRRPCLRAQTGPAPAHSRGRRRSAPAPPSGRPAGW